MFRSDTFKPSWDRLYETASMQEGHFTIQQAADAGYSPQALHKHLLSGRIRRVCRRIYRLKHYPTGDYEELSVIWLWSEHQAVFSHETALMLHGLSDALPATTHVTLPTDWRRRRLKLPPHTTLHFGEVPAGHRTWFGSVPITVVGRTILDCAVGGSSPEILAQAARQANQRGLLSEAERSETEMALETFGVATS